MPWVLTIMQFPCQPFGYHIHAIESQCNHECDFQRACCCCVDCQSVPILSPGPFSRWVLSCRSLPVALCADSPSSRIPVPKCSMLPFLEHVDFSWWFYYLYSGANSSSSGNPNFRAVQSARQVTTIGSVQRTGVHVQVCYLLDTHTGANLIGRWKLSRDKMMTSKPMWRKVAAKPTFTWKAKRNPFRRKARESKKKKNPVYSSIA